MHNIADCPQTPLLANFNQTLSRLDAHMLRSAIAMETMAAQGATLEAHTTQIGKNTKDISNAWKVIRTMEIRHAEEDGAEEVVEEQQKFWSGVKQQFTLPALTGVCLIFWLLDKFNVIQLIAKWLKEMKG